ncbi:MAG: SpoIIE family protein phosphatase [Xanthomonadales bacterium]|nr:SpoIIE family protein phosphatase [Xanthomonadales bacterium]
MDNSLRSTETRIETLRKCEFLQGLKGSVLSDLAAKAETLSVDRGKKIITRGEDGSNMYFIISGSARVHHGEVILANIGTGDVFGEMAVLDSEKRSASVTAESNTLLLVIERDMFYESLSTDPNAFKAVIHGVLQRGREIIREVKTRSTKLMAYEKEMEIGRQIQAGFLPNSLPALENWELASSFVAAREVAGDFYDVFKLNTLPHLAIVIGDVCDKGVGAALFMTLFRSLIRASSLYGNVCSSLVDAESGSASITAGEVLQNSLLTTNRYIATTHAGSSMFASVFFGLLDTDSGELHYVNAGHESPIIFRQNGETEVLDITGGVIGLFPAAQYAVEAVTLNKGDLIFAYTDGVNEAKNPQGEQFGESRIMETTDPQDTSPDKFLSMILDAIYEFRGVAEQSDDITMLALKSQSKTSTA